MRREKWFSDWTPMKSLLLLCFIYKFSVSMDHVDTAGETIPEFDFPCFVDVCTFPRQYCDSDWNERRCGQCTSALCLEKEVPRACLYFCQKSDRTEIIQADSLPGFIHNYALLWFSLTLALVACIVLIAATSPLWISYLRKKLTKEYQKSLPIGASGEIGTNEETGTNKEMGTNNEKGTDEETKKLLPQVAGKNAAQDGTGEITETSMSTVDESEETLENKDASMANGTVSTDEKQSFCKGKLMNVNPTEEHSKSQKRMTTLSPLPARSETDLLKIDSI